MKTYTQKPISTYALTAITCDKCGTSVDADDVLEAQEWICVRINGGYSSIFGDGADLSCDLCQLCVRDLFGPFLKDMKSVSSEAVIPLLP